MRNTKATEASCAVREAKRLRRNERAFKTLISEDVITSVTSRIRDRQFKPGSRLPSERDLALELGVSRPSVRHALSTLAQMGIVETRQGAGTHVVKTTKNLLKTPFELMVLLDQPSIYELYEVREVLEMRLVGRAAERRSDEDLRAIKAALDAMPVEVTQTGSYVHSNMRFHAAIATAARNPFMERILFCLHDSIQSCIEAAEIGVLDWKVSVEIHEPIYDAIRRHSVIDAQKAMEAHMAMAFDELRRLNFVNDFENDHEPGEVSA